MNSSAEIFDDRGRKSKSEQLIIEEQRIEIERLKATIADVVSEDLEIKKRLENACRGGGGYEITLL